MWIMIMRSYDSQNYGDLASDDNNARRNDDGAHLCDEDLW